MRDISDEMLMAYTDNELDGEGRACVETYLTEDPAGVARLAVFATTGRALAGIFDKPMNEPVPQRLIDTIVNSAGPTAGVPSAKVIPFGKPHRPAALSGQALRGLAAACAGLVIAGVGLNWILQSQNRGSTELYGLMVLPNGLTVARAELGSALDTTPSGGTVSKPIDGVVASIKPVFTFAAARGGYCRQYEILQSDSKALGGVACRTSEGQWQIEGQTRVAASADDNGDIKPAGKTSSVAIDDIVDRMITGDVLGLESESGLMKNGWQGPGATSPNPAR
jgi:17 kDa common-antigen outer membrane protein